MKQVLSRRSKFERREDRAKIGSIGSNLVLSKTLARYEICFDDFSSFIRSLKDARVCSESEFVDGGLVQYLEHLWQEGEGLAVANYTLAGILHFIPSLRTELSCSRRIIKGWQRLELPARATPLTLDMLLAMCGLFVIWGVPHAAYCLLVGFDLFLRTHEFTGLRLGMFTMNGECTSCVLSFLDGTKTSSRKVAATEALVIRDHLVLSVVKRLLCPSRKLQPGDYASGLTPSQFVHIFGKAVTFLKLTNFNVRPYSVRRGGATNHFRLNANMAMTVVKGRWASPRSARIYIEDGLAALGQVKLTALQTKDTESLKHIFLRHCKQ